MYRYETHLHTHLISACSNFTPEEIVEKYISLGYAGIFVTDHFLNGNTTVSRDLPYKERVRAYCKGYEAVKKAAEGSGLSVFFGIESSYYGTDFLFFGLDGEWYESHPEILSLTTRQLCHYIREAGGLVVQAHPFHEAPYIDHMRLFPSDVDGIETQNACKSDRANRLADNLANEYSLAKTAGSDIHTKGQKMLAGVQFETPIKDEKDFVLRVKAGEGELFRLVDERE
ncbi:MAG: PHP domain-containing protein [Clostridia bacterium]|nr:PHP domain-containing protein [Clostridia bacterium]